MNRSILVMALVAALLFSKPVGATTFGSQKATCPVCGHKFTGRVVASYGSYIYRWASKVHLVFWPLTAGFHWWICQRCGYAALSGDFGKLTPKSKAAIKAKIRPLWKQPKNISFAMKMTQAEACYKLRGKKADFWILFYRALGWNFGRTSAKGKSYQAKARALMEKKLLVKGLDGRTRKEFNYLIGEYYRQAGNRKKARARLKKALTLKWTRGGKFNANAQKYINELIKASLALLSGKRSK